MMRASALPLLLLLGACGGDPAGPAAPGVATLESLLPNDAIAIVRLRSLDVLARYADLGPIPTDPLPRLARMFTFDPATVDRTRPLALTVARRPPRRSSFPSRGQLPRLHPRG
ncbi:MAG: hypothetical protein HC813_01215, partial [Planctomycetes bacterium]|nr:hypothetical protein [Planctomycetota bacterium]